MSARPEETIQSPVPDAAEDTVRAAALSRRHAVASVAVAGLAVPVLAACGSDGDTEDPVEETPQPGSEGPEDSATEDSGTEDSGESEEPAESGDSGGDSLASTSDIPEGGGVIFADQEVVVTQPSAGEFKAFSAVCTHQGCLVSEVTETIDCACHASKFSLTDGSPVSGPAKTALAEQTVTVNGDSITLG